MVPDPESPSELQHRQLQIETTTTEEPLKVRYGFKNNSIVRRPKQPNVIVTKKPFRNSVVITATKSSIVAKDDLVNSDDDWTVYNFIKSIVNMAH